MLLLLEWNSEKCICRLLMSWFMIIGKALNLKVKLECFETKDFVEEPREIKCV